MKEKYWLHSGAAFRKENWIFTQTQSKLSVSLWELFKDVNLLTVEISVWVCTINNLKAVHFSNCIRTRLTVNATGHKICSNISELKNHLKLKKGNKMEKNNNCEVRQDLLSFIDKMIDKIKGTGYEKNWLKSRDVVSSPK